MFANTTWRIAPEPFPLAPDLVRALEQLGQDLLAFYRACNVMVRHSRAGTLPQWITDYLDAGKPRDLVETSRLGRFKGEIPRVIRPDVILNDDHFFITELDSVPGGIGLTGWLGKTYGELGHDIVGSPHGMMEGFSRILQLERGPATVVVSEEAATYRPEMEWLGQQCGFRVMSPEDLGAVLPLEDGAPATPQPLTIYRFFELFDLANIPKVDHLIQAAARGQVKVTPPFKPQLEEKMLFAFLWLGQLREFWREQLGEKTLRRLQECFPYTWIVDPAPLPPHAVIPQLGIQHWRELGRFSQKQRELVLKISGFHEHAWGARGVYVGHDLSAHDWTAAVERAIEEFAHHPYILQQFEKSCLVDTSYADFERGEIVPFRGRARLCPYYFVAGDQAHLGGVLATICPADKKLIHGMSDAVLAPCSPLA